MTLALTNPRDAYHEAARLRIAMRRKDGTWDWDAEDSEIVKRLTVESIGLGVNERPHRARLAVNPAGEHASGTELMPSLSMGEFADKFDPTQRIVIYAEAPETRTGGGASSRAFLFDGFAATPQMQFSENEVRYQVLCVSLLEQIDAQPEAWIRGRYIAFDVGGTPTVQRVTATRCVFNFKGKPNRHPDLQTWGAFENVPAFTYDGDPNGVYWKICDVLKYLMVFYFEPAALRVGIVDGNCRSRCETHVSTNGDPFVGLDPNTATFYETIETQCPELPVHEMNVHNALLLLCRTAGFRMTQVTTNEDGEPVTSLVLWMAGEGGPYRDYGSDTEDRVIETDDDDRLLPEPRSICLPTERQSLADLSDTPEVAQSEVLFDSAGIVNTARRIGDPVVYEVTVGRLSAAADVLKPGWASDSMFGDDLSGGDMEDKIELIAEAKDGDAEGDAATMFARYDRRGDRYYTYRNVGRLWVLNEAGEYDGTTYGHSNGGGTAWAAAAYNTPYNFHTLAGVPKIEDPDGAGELEWIPRRRAVLDPLSEPTSGGQKSPVLECSWDSGSHWYPYPGNFSIVGGSDPLTAQVAVMLGDANLGQVINEAPQSGDGTVEQSVWEAIVRGTFRLALTCCVEGDECVYGNAGQAAAWGNVSRHIDLPAAVEELGKKQLANSRLDGETGWAAITIDDADKAASQASTYVARFQSLLISANLVIPWVTNNWLPGDLCTGIQPRGVSFKTIQSNIERYPEVVRTLIRSGSSGQSTHITLDDYRTVTRHV